MATSFRPQCTPGVSSAGRRLVNRQTRRPVAGSRRGARRTAAGRLHGRSIHCGGSEPGVVQSFRPRIFSSLGRPRRGSRSRCPGVGWGALAGGPARTPQPVTVLSPRDYAGPTGAAARLSSRSPMGPRGLPVTGHLRARPGRKGTHPTLSPRHERAHPAPLHTTAEAIAKSGVA